MGGWYWKSVLNRIRIKNAELKMKKCLTIILILAVLQISAQDKTETFQKARKLREESKFTESLAVFQSLLKEDSSNVEYLHNTAYLLCKTLVLQEEDTQR